ncbi:MAG: ATP-binding protein [Dehalococcoidia bacterium]
MISIRPAVSVYATYRRLSYRPWYAMAEFVDNSTQSYYNHREALQTAFKSEELSNCLRIEISYDSDRNLLEIIDNANGMELDELTRAIVLDSPPPVRSGRCEYGMGLKTAACWFGSTWTIRTTKLGSQRELMARIHIPDLIDRQSENIRVEVKEADAADHFTAITIEGLYKPIRGRTPGRIREQLGSMYREDLRSGEVEILWNAAPVSYAEPSILTETLDGGITNVWRKDINFNVDWMDETLPVVGWIGLRTPGNQRDAGFVLLRRGRVVVGGPGEGFKPAEVFGQGNTFRSQRLIGELHLDDWPVTQAKDAFDWSGGLEDAFVDRLKSICRDYMDKAEGHREKTHKLSESDLILTSEPSQSVFKDKRFSAAIAEELRFPDPPKSDAQERADSELLKGASIGPVQYVLDIGAEEWIFRLHWQDQLSDAHWMQVNYPQDNIIDLFLNLAHPFFRPYLGRKDSLELLQKVVIALALAEKMARQTSQNGLVSPSDFRVYMNKVLRRAAEIQEVNGV